jgi:hypothetical protein
MQLERFMTNYTPIYKCRRSIIALVGLGCLTWLGYSAGQEVAGSIAAIVLAVAASNAGQSAVSAWRNPRKENKEEVDNPDK